MRKRRKPITILVADDDQDDCLLIKDALSEIRLADELHFVEDGEALLEYLHSRGSDDGCMMAPNPDLILLDLNMPRKDGREALRELKSDPRFRKIPIVVLTTSREKEDIFYTYDHGANSFITKPETFEGLLDLMKSLGQFWFETVILPTEVMETRNERSQGEDPPH